MGTMKHLYRSHTNRVLGGICGGLGKNFGIYPLLVRLVWLLLILFGGLGLILYPIAWLIIPLAPDSEEGRPTTEYQDGIGKGRFWWGLALVALGVVLWGSQFRFIYWPVIPGVHVHSRDLVPFALLLVGIYLLYTFARTASGRGKTEGIKLYRNRDDRKIGGVCGGIAEYFQIDSTLVRILFVIGTFFYLAGGLIYLVLLIALSEKPFEAKAEPVKKTPAVGPSPAKKPSGGGKSKKEK
jgi:phage shock protein PspC (stress-responsive transcriptional regulator)